MKKIGSRTFMILLMTLAFFAGLTYHTGRLVLHSAEWTASPMSGHIKESDGLKNGGKIMDRNGVILSQSIDGRRIYHEDEAVRKACLHVVGDDSVNIGTAIQTVARNRLTDYEFTGSFVFGLGLPEALKNGEDIITRGNDIRLTIDSRLQTAALDALGNYKGAMIFYNYKTGEIVCMVSTPTYDPQNVPEDINTNSAYEGAYLNRAVSAAYPPGSTFKLVTAAAALNEIPDIEQSVYECTGREKIGDHDVVCYETHGKVNMQEALAKSCNVYFAKLAVALGKNKMTYYADKMGFNKEISFDGIVSKKSVYDVAEADENQLAWSGVGQYTLLETPLNMAMISAAVANGGTPVMPYLIDSVNGVPEHSVTTGQEMMDRATADKLYEMMDYTVQYSYGKDYVCSALDVCAKTGTAEVSDDGTAHAWVTGFCKDEDCPLAFAVLVEYGDYAYSVAIPAAGKVLYKAAEIYKNQ